MAGRKPVPTNLKLLRGNPGKRKLNDREPQPNPGKPRVPSHLDDEARREWHRMADKLLELGLLTEIDRAALAAYCVAWSRWVDAENKVRQYGLVMLSPDKGWPIQSPYLAIANKAMEQMRALLVEFGMSPSSRSRIQTTAPKPPQDQFEELFGDRRSS